MASSAAFFFISLISIGVYLYTPEIYPTRARAIGITSSACWGRIASFVAPNVVGALMGAWGLGSVFLCFAAVAAFAAVVAGVFVSETRFKVLEKFHLMRARLIIVPADAYRVPCKVGIIETQRNASYWPAQLGRGAPTDRKRISRFKICHTDLSPRREEPRGGVAIGDCILDLRAALRPDSFKVRPKRPPSWPGSTLNALMGLRLRWPAPCADAYRRSFRRISRTADGSSQWQHRCLFRCLTSGSSSPRLWKALRIS